VGGIVFGLDCRLHGRRETLTIGKYGRDGIRLAEARDRCIEARLSELFEQAVRMLVRGRGKND
jgi:hypothetical protein